MIADKCSEANFSFTGEDKAEFIEGFKVFKYLGWMMGRSHDYLPELLRNIRKMRQVWGIDGIYPFSVTKK